MLVHPNKKHWWGGLNQMMYEPDYTYKRFPDRIPRHQQNTQFRSPKRHANLALPGQSVLLDLLLLLLLWPQKDLRDLENLLVPPLQPLQ